jgi:hypothetical protein
MILKHYYKGLDMDMAAFLLYANTTSDKRATAMEKFIRYGTNDERDIWLLRYGFAFEGIEWIGECVEHIDQYGIVFNDNIEKLDSKRAEIISRYL